MSVVRLGIQKLEEHKLAISLSHPNNKKKKKYKLLI
jgi:hypothetical protein